MGYTKIELLLKTLYLTCTTKLLFYKVTTSSIKEAEYISSYLLKFDVIFTLLSNYGFVASYHIYLYKSPSQIDVHLV